MYKSIFQERLNRAVTIRGIKQTQLSEKTGISRAQISEYISGKCKPKQNKLYLISVALNVNPMWLLGFDVPMDNEETSIKREIINKLDRLTEKQLEALNVIIDTLFADKPS